ncbi:hypothetical protein MHBO_002371 [Bonamia ostreae]
MCRDANLDLHSIICSKNNKFGQIAPDFLLSIKMALEDFESDFFEHLIDKSKKSEQKDKIEYFSKKIANLKFVDDKSLKLDEKALEIQNNLEKICQIVKKCCFALKLPVFDEYPYALSIFPKSSLFNHSCDPNCHVLFEENKIKFYSLKKIFFGEELTFSYAQNIKIANLNKRLTFLKQNFDFDCLCSFCCNNKQNENSENDEQNENLINQSSDIQAPKPSYIEIYSKIDQILIENGNKKDCIEAIKQILDQIENEKILKSKIFSENSQNGQNLEIVDKIANIAILTKQWSIGYKTTKMALQILKQFFQTSKNPKNKKIYLKKKKENPKREQNKISFYPLLELKMRILLILFKSLNIKTENEYFEAENEMFEEAEKARVLLKKYYGEDDWKKVLDILERVHRGFCSVTKIIDSVDGYFGYN